MSRLFMSHYLFFWGLHFFKKTGDGSGGEDVSMESEEGSETVSYHAPSPTDSSIGVSGQLPPGIPGVPFIPEASSVSLGTTGFHGFSPSGPPTLGEFLFVLSLASFSSLFISMFYLKMVVEGVSGDGSSGSGALVMDFSEEDVGVGGVSLRSPGPGESTEPHLSFSSPGAFATSTPNASDVSSIEATVVESGEFNSVNRPSFIF